MKCFFPHCENESRGGLKNVAFFRFPVRNSDRELWLQFCGLTAEVKLSESHRVCSLHFREEDLYKDTSGKIRKINGAVPCFRTVSQLNAGPKLNNPEIEAEAREEETIEEYGEVEYLDESFWEFNPASTDSVNSHPTQREEEFYDVEYLDGTDMVDLNPPMQEEATPCFSCFDNVNQVRQYKTENENLKRKLNDCEDELSKIRSVVKDDQYSLMTGLKKIAKWSDDSLIEGFKTRFICGSTAYEVERKKRYLPSTRTLQEKLQNIHFDNGCLDEIFRLLRHKVASMPDKDKDAAIVFDEMAIQPGSNYCSNLKKYVGPVTLCGNGELANHLLVFMLVGMSSRWKQVVGYHFTGDSVENGGIKSILFELINKAEEIGLHVHAVISDCGGGNKKLWNDIGVKHSREKVMSNAPIVHPFDPTRTLEIVPDAVHVFKSMIHGWIKNRTIQLPEFAVKKHGLSSSTADITHLTELVAYEATCDLKMACGLTLEDVNFSKTQSNFDKMKVKNATKYANHTVVSALRCFSAQSGRKELLTTAFFLEMASSWYSYMTARTPALALSYTNKTAYAKAIRVLEDFKELVYGCEVGIKKHWKPWQSAIILTTDSMLRLHKYFLDVRKYDFFLGGRLTQDCLENVFSQLRQRQMRPTALQAKDNMKLLSMAQYMADIKNSSYDWDSREWLVGFSDRLKEGAGNKSQTEKSEADSTAQPPGLVESEDDLVQYCENLCNRASEQNVVYYLAGMIVRKISQHNSVCQECINSCLAPPSFETEYTVFTSLKDYTGNALTSVNVETYNFFLELEEIFKQQKEYMVAMNENLENHLWNKMNTISASHIPSCHGLRNKLIMRYIRFRLKVNRVKLSREKRCDSRSMAV